MKEWLNAFLSSRVKGEDPDGRPLYQYRINSEEYLSLKHELSNDWNPVESSPCGNALFVLYASECWRRNYAGGKWTWDLVLSGLEKEDLKAKRLGDLVEVGFQYWGRAVHFFPESRRRDFLGTVLKESGIPDFALSKGQRLRSIILNSYKKLGEIAIAEDRLLTIAELLPANFPQVLNQESFYKLIATIVDELRDLKERFGLGQQDNPIQFLDAHTTNWRDLFPIQVDGEAGSQFLDDILTDSAREKESAPESFNICIRHFFNPETQAIVSRLFLPATEYSKRSLEIDDFRFSGLSNKVKFILSNDSNHYLKLGFGLKSGESGIRYIGKEQFLLSNNAYLHSWNLNLEDNRTGESFQLPLPRGEILDSGEPWIFKEKESSWELVSTSSARLSSKEVKIICPTGFQVQCESFEEKPFGPSQKVLTTGRDCLLTFEDFRYRIILNSTGEDSSFFRIIGKGLDYYPHDNMHIFKDVPKVFRLNLNTGKFTACRNVGLTNSTMVRLNEHFTQDFGSMELTVRSNEGDFLFRKKVFVLPPEFEYSFTESKSVVSIQLIGTQDFRVSMLAEKLGGEIRKTYQGHEIIIPLEDQDSIPESLLLEMVSENFGSVTIRIPFPQESVRLFYNREQADPDQPLYVNRLHGYSIHYFHHDRPKHKLVTRLMLVADDVHENFAIPGAVRSGIPKPIYQLREEVHTLFAYTQRLNAQVNLLVGNEIIASIRQFQAEGRYDKESTVFRFTGLGDNPDIKAFRFDCPIDNKSFIQITDSPEPGTWNLPDKLQNQGAWLVYPSSSSGTLFKPFLYRSGAGVESVDKPLESRHEAAIIQSPEIRKNMLGDFFCRIAPDFSNRAWTEVWKIFDETSHLPLNTFDEWTALSMSSRGLISLFFQMTDTTLLEKLNYDLLVDWFSFSIEDWVELTMHWKIHLDQEYENPGEAKRALKADLERIDAWLGLEMVSRICSEEIGGEQSVSGMTIDILQDLLDQWINGEEGYPGVIGKHDGQQWPDELAGDIKNGFNALPDDLRNAFPDELIRAYKPVIYIPALIAYRSMNPEWTWIDDSSKLVKYRINMIIDFDREWFLSTYNLFQSFIWAS